MTNKLMHIEHDVEDEPTTSVPVPGIEITDLTHSIARATGHDTVARLNATIKYSEAYFTADLPGLGTFPIKEAKLDSERGWLFLLCEDSFGTFSTAVPADSKLNFYLGTL